MDETTTPHDPPSGLGGRYRGFDADHQGAAHALGAVEDCPACRGEVPRPGPKVWRGVLWRYRRGELPPPGPRMVVPREPEIPTEIPTDLPTGGAVVEPLGKATE